MSWAGNRGSGRTMRAALTGLGYAMRRNISPIRTEPRLGSSVMIKVVHLPPMSRLAGRSCMRKRSARAASPGSKAISLQIRRTRSLLG